MESLIYDGNRTMHNKKNRRITIRLTILTTFFLVCGLVAAMSLSLHYFFGMKSVRLAAEKQFYQIAERTSERSLELEKTGISFAFSLKNNRNTDETLHPKKTHPLAQDMAQLLHETNGIFSLFIGFSNGDYLEVSNLEAASNLREVWQAAPNDRWVKVKILNVDGQRVRITQYLNDDLSVRFEKYQASDYFASDRPWFEEAVVDKVTKKPPYLFQFIQRPGTSYSIRTDKGAVVGATTLTSSLDQLLRNSQFPNTSRSFIFDENGMITAYNSGKETPKLTTKLQIPLTSFEKSYLKSLPPLKVANMNDYPPFEYTVSGTPRGYSVELLKILSSQLGIELTFVNGYQFPELMELFYDGKVDVMLSMMRTNKREEFGAFSVPITLPEIVAVTDQRKGYKINRIDDLQGLRIAAQRGYAVTQYLKRILPKEVFIETADTLSALELLRDDKLDAVIDHKTVLKYNEHYFFLENLSYSPVLSDSLNQSLFALHFLVRKEHQPLIPLLNKAYHQMDDKVKNSLRSRWLVFSDKDSTTESQLTSGKLPSAKLLDYAKQTSRQGTSFSMLIDGRAHYAFVDEIDGFIDSNRKEFIGLLVEKDEAEFSFKRDLWIAIGITCALLLLLIPIVMISVSSIVKPINLLVHENNKIRRREFEKVKHTPTVIREIHQLSLSLVNLSESICDYEVAQRELMDAFIRLIAQAIDEKSPYTGGHCERVPKIAFLLAEKACESNKGNLKNFQFSSRDEWREFKVAAWLHDCGKITTPEHIVDKGSKLESIYNRIHEIRMRFEVLWRDAEISYFEKILENPDQVSRYKSELEIEHQRIKDDFAFVASCNVGSEFMDDEQIDRLTSIAKRTWVRNLDDRLGLSPDEQEFIKDFSKVDAPAIENLLQDREEHIKIRENSSDKYQGFGFTLQAPAVKQNLGELYNLSVKKGTLTDEDRFIINEHIITTIRMLETLPLPQELSKVPEYAGGHHEKMNGGGYPRGLTGDQLSIPAKIMAIADIFEALTASDRPYKKAKTLSQSLFIMRNMALEGHIDPELFRLFIEERVYRDYAESCLMAEQIDKVEEDSLLVGID